MRLRAIAALIAAAFSLGVASPADAYLDSGLPAGPIGAPVISTPAYTAVSDVLIVGDSITVRGYRDLAAALPGYRLAVNAQSGRNTTLSVDEVLKMPYIPPALVMAVGANDIFNTSVMRAQVKRLLAAVPATTKVFWVNVSVRRPATALADQWNSSQVNQAITSGCVRSCTVISWAGFLSAKASRRPTYIDRGGVHPIVHAGTEAWATLLADSVKVALRG